MMKAESKASVFIILAFFKVYIQTSFPTQTKHPTYFTIKNWWPTLLLITSKKKKDVQ